MVKKLKLKTIMILTIKRFDMIKVFKNIGDLTKQVDYTYFLKSNDLEHSTEQNGNTLFNVLKIYNKYDYRNLINITDNANNYNRCKNDKNDNDDNNIQIKITSNFCETIIYYDKLDKNICVIYPLLATLEIIDDISYEKSYLQKIVYTYGSSWYAGGGSGDY